MEDGGFEIEICFAERPPTNAFRFAIEGAEDLDFFYQPELAAEETAESAVRTENVIGSYAANHKTKANHRVGGANYAIGEGISHLSIQGGLMLTVRGGVMMLQTKLLMGG